MPKRKKKKEEPLGPVATRFSEYLDTGLHEFDKCFQDYAPYYVQHLDLGKGLLFSQSPVDKDAGQSLKDFASRGVGLVDRRNKNFLGGKNIMQPL